MNKIKFEPFGDLVVQAFSQFKENSINSQDQHSQTGNLEIPGAKYPNENNSKDPETNKTSAVPIFMQQLLPEDEIERCKSFKQGQVFDVVHTWIKDCVEYDEHNAEPTHIFFPGSRGISKSHLVKVACNVISKTLFYHCKDPEKPRVLSLEPTGISLIFF